MGDPAANPPEALGMTNTDSWGDTKMEFLSFHVTKFQKQFIEYLVDHKHFRNKAEFLRFLISEYYLQCCKGYKNMSKLIIGIDICPYCMKGPIRPLTAEELNPQNSGTHYCEACQNAFDQKYILEDLK